MDSRFTVEGMLQYLEDIEDPNIIDSFAFEYTDDGFRKCPFIGVECNNSSYPCIGERHAYGACMTYIEHTDPKRFNEIKLAEKEAAEKLRKKELFKSIISIAVIAIIIVFLLYFEATVLWVRIV